mmetsp:Transcript_36067/g.79277  ORF Transcript_36067/g.79277 Transcript_36067/m.79277 type:complete len:104 (-) Transcript_36067:419-730(-)
MPSVGSLASTASTMNYRVFQTEDTYTFVPFCWFNPEKCKVTIEKGKLIITPNERTNRKSEVALTMGGHIVLPKRADISAEPEVIADKQGLQIIMPKLKLSAVQ